ncbi:unnamed protein product [Rotaria socialis]|uniref:Uncharacterized protein n=1 Tax=Rotaria socialis TaxID=392032 RepID=A0A820SVP6_9BILA|nr:unnamed protein product [Rotaria socialis]CAF4457078.1 unnamed protein product [Rotaria socialis]
MELELVEKHIEHQVQATELVNALTQLSVCSIGEFQLNMKIKKALHQAKTSKHIVPILIDNTKETTVGQENKEFVSPDGWKRFGIKVADNGTAFNAKWGSWHIAYHGTKGQHVPFILTSGLCVAIQQYSTSKNNQTIFLSPSIEYMAHPQHTRIWRHIQKDDGKCRYYQLVFQCRVNPEAVGDPKSETLLQETYKITRVDKDFCNEELEWFIKANAAAKEFIHDNIICYGLMIRVIDCHPYDLPILSWWKNTDCGEY